MINIIYQGPGQKQPSRPKLADVVHASITIQRAFRRYKKRKEERKKLSRKEEQTKSKLKSQKSEQELSKKAAQVCLVCF
jgi:hypothetical protein